MLRLISIYVGVIAIALALHVWLYYLLKDDDLASSIWWVIFTVTAIARRRGNWPVGVFFSLSLLCAYLEHRLGNEHAHDVFRVLYSIGIAVYLFSDTISKWMKKLWGRIRSAGLTLINQASFRRQSKEAFQ